ncbi:hypothetical protein [Arsenicicoccus dermatophilus]|uniref:hypothetical protein n=1 Tax=Arsenicicoccus dermatophilus TaxID=1076331 RepID=UPI0039175428
MSRTSAIVLGATALFGGAAAAPALAAPATTTTTTATTTVTAARPTLTTVGRARLALPTGWKATWNPHGLRSWCLHPAGTTTCDVLYIEQVPEQQVVDTETHGGFEADPHYCPDHSNGPLTRYATLSLGGRAAEYRRWDITCGRTAGPTVIQYVTPIWPASVLFAETTRAKGNRTDAVLAQIARGSVLPKQTRPQRMSDVGYVRAVAKVKGGQRITLDRVLLDGRGGVINKARTTYTYVVPTAARREAFRVGRLVSLRGDGYRITNAY